MRTPSLLLFAALLAASAHAASPDECLSVLSSADGSVAGSFDSYTLALSWEPTFCEGKPGAPECASQRSDRFDASNLALHGLWPNKNCDPKHVYVFCGVDKDEQSRDTPPQWCGLPLPQHPPISAAALVDLTTVMPGVASCLEHHEWLKHGTCSGMGIDDYFETAAGFVRQVAGSAFGRFLTLHAGETIDASAATAAFEASFGAGSGDKLSLNCTDVRGAKALLEVRLNLKKGLHPGSELSSELSDVKDHGNCPASFLLDPIPSR
jgi:ribonuclease T2